jgi:methyl-accepting chemotaxis protein
MRDFAGAWLQMKQNQGEMLTKVFVTDNPNPPDKRMNLDPGPPDLPNSVSHAKYNRGFRQQLLAHKYADIYLIGVDGNTYYSVTKGTDFTASVTAEGSPLAGSGLAKLFSQAAAQTKAGGPVVHVDFAPYAPDGSISAFVGLPLFNTATGRITGVLAFRILPDLIAKVVSDRTGLGNTGEVLVVGADHTLRGDAVFDEGNNVLKTRVDSAVIDTALAGTAAQGIMTGYRDAEMLVSAAPVPESPGWAVAGVMTTSEAFAPIEQLRNTMLLVGGLLLAIAAALGLAFSRSVTGPLSRLTSTMNGLAEGNLDLEINGTRRTDEIGEMARTVEVFRDNALKISAMTDAEREASVQRRVERTDMMQVLEKAFGEVVDAAQRGDFSRRVDTEFPDRELNAIAASINNLVQTVDRGLSETGHVLSALANTDLTRRAEGSYQGAFEQLKSDTNAVAEKLNHIVGQLKLTSRNLKTATSEILSGANDLSERTTKQATTIEETSAVMDQLATTVMDNARSALEATAAAAGVMRTAEEGGQVMSHATEAMERIWASSGKIGNIISLIDDIAFQTNLLALNASVEAARAGESGKGFAVVAVEVRRLAQSAAQASSEVKGLIEQSGAEVKTGFTLVTEAGKKLEAILAAARCSSDLMEGIARQCQVQATSIEEVGAAVRQMDEMTQHNAALVEETNAAIEQTEGQANELDRIVEVFRLVEAADYQIVGDTSGTPPAARIKPRQQRVRLAAQTYLSDGNAAVKKDGG